MKTECPRCGEIELNVKDNGEATCECGHFEMHQPKQPGFDDFVHRVGFDMLDDIGLMDAMRLAFVAGRARRRAHP